MNKYVIGIDGMRCGMCEIHVEETIEKALKVHKVKASRLKGQAIVFSEAEFAVEDFKKVLDPTGYRITSFEKQAAVKTFFGWR